MTDPTSGFVPESDAAHEALLSLHALAGTFEDADPGVGPGFGGGRATSALVTLADAPESEVSLGARLDVLHALAGRGFPNRESNDDDYRRLAESIAAPNQIDVETVLNDLEGSARGGLDFASTPAGRALPHGAAAFVGQPICHTKEVTVDGKPATWIFSEFETDASFDDLADWVNPETWARRGPMLFKKMELVGGTPTPLTGISAGQHWHAEFLEEVQLVDRLKTILHCDYFSQPGQAVGTTYDLTFSVDHQITVDRGFLLATDLGQGKSRVKVLKIVGFKDGEWDTVARFVCPFWTDWVRSAVESGTVSTPRDPTEAPPGKGRPAGGDLIPDDDVVDEWVDFFGESTKTYAHLMSDVARKAVSGRYRMADATRDGARYWSQLAKDWARAWAYGYELLQDMAEEGVEITPAPPEAGSSPRRHAAGPETTRRMTSDGGEDTVPPAGAAAAGAPRTGSTSRPRPEGVTIPVPGLDEATPTGTSDLVSIEVGSFVIPASRVTTEVIALQDGTPAVQVTVATAGTPPGLYVGTLDLKGRGSIPIQLYVSHAVQTRPR